MRDITLEETFYHFFTTRAFASGVPTQLAGSPVLSVLEENNATPITAGVSVQVDRASVTGLNQATIVATAANGYEAGKSYSIYISTGTVGGVSVVGEVVGEFTVQAGAAFKRLGAPAGASIAADLVVIDDFLDTEIAAILVDTGTTLDDFIDTEIATIITDIAAVKADTAAILVDTGTTGVPVAAGGIATTSFAAGAIDAAAIAASAIGASEIATGAIDADALAADAVDEILDDTIGDGTITVRQALRVLVAGMAAKLSGAATATVTIRNVADSANVIVATVDADGNRTATTVTP